MFIGASGAIFVVGGPARPDTIWSSPLEIAMADSNDGGIVKRYVDQFLALGVKNHSGEKSPSSRRAGERLVGASGRVKVRNSGGEQIKLLAQSQLQAGLAAAAPPAKRRC
jgi:hypothetical protein